MCRSRRFRGVKTVLENRPPIGWHTFSSDLICQRMPPVPTFPPMAIAMVALTPLSMSVQIWNKKCHAKILNYGQISNSHGQTRKEQTKISEFFLIYCSNTSIFLPWLDYPFLLFQCLYYTAYICGSLGTKMPKIQQSQTTRQHCIDLLFIMKIICSFIGIY